MLFFVVSQLHCGALQANQGTACTEMKAKRRSRCIHTLLVVLDLWVEDEMRNEAIYSNS